MIGCDDDSRTVTFGGQKEHGSIGGFKDEKTDGCAVDSNKSGCCGS
jgi:hypothetical protein